MQEKSDYILDFVIPSGEKGDTGPTGLKGDIGPTGATGPTGPTLVKAVLSLDYINASSNGTVSISDSNKVLVPDNNTIFTNTESEITINKDGFYEFYLFGLLEEISTQEGAQLILNVGNAELMSVTLPSNENAINFSRIRFKQCISNEKVVLTFHKTNTSNAVCKNTYLIIKNYVIAD